MSRFIESLPDECYLDFFANFGSEPVYMDSYHHTADILWKRIGFYEANIEPNTGTLYFEHNNKKYIPVSLFTRNMYTELCFVCRKVSEVYFARFSVKSAHHHLLYSGKIEVDVKTEYHQRLSISVLQTC